MKDTRTARRMDEIQPFHVMQLLARARALEAEGRDIVHMEIGEPDFTAPEPVVQAGVKALQSGQTHYTPATGLPELKLAIAGFYRERYGVEVSPGRIVITPGASGALLLAVGVLLEAGEDLLMADPGYPCNRNFARFVEGKGRLLPVNADNGYQLSLADVELAWDENSGAVLLASPSNPTGTLVAEEEMAAIAEFVAAKQGHLIVDEIYHGLIYDVEAQTALAVTDEAFVINSFSKYFNMTGWRLGWMVVPEEYVPSVDKLAQNLFLAAPTPAQHAALAAFDPKTMKILEQRRLEYQRRRDYLLPALRELGFEIPVTPHGAFYIYADCSKFSDDSTELSRRLLEEAGVAVTPGIDFGHHRANEHLRFAYTTSLERLQEGVRRLGRFLGA
ncbi:MAG: pyridoxal phosphate-dependent aminotransferase [Gammaproteobacteria bacterium]|nr:pyridoxal phosphate-dependent aminotransferase [Gammaproteobacteria bacterium]